MCRRFSSSDFLLDSSFLLLLLDLLEDVEVELTALLPACVFTIGCFGAVAGAERAALSS